MNRVLGLSAVVSFVLFALAAWAYPGGNHFDHHAAGHDFWRNAICDVARATAVGGRPNPVGSVLARLAMVTMAIGVGALLWSLPCRFASRPRLGRVVRVLAAFTVPATIAVALLPTDRFGMLHGVVVMLAGIPGAVAAGAAAYGLLHAPDAPRSVVFFAVATLAVTVMGLSSYGAELLFGGPSRPEVPALERVASLLVLAWMLSESRGAKNVRNRCMDGPIRPITSVAGSSTSCVSSRAGGRPGDGRYRGARRDHRACRPPRPRRARTR